MVSDDVGFVFREGKESAKTGVLYGEEIWGVGILFCFFVPGRTISPPHAHTGSLFFL